MAKITIEKAEIAVISIADIDYISLTDIANSQMEEHIIIKWLSLKSTIEYIGEWEALYNPRFNYTEFSTIKNEAGSNNFVLSVKQWIEQTGAIGITAKAGWYGGTYAHKDIAFHFGMWISPRLQLLLDKEFQHLKEAEQKLLGWSAKRELAKINYHIHTDAIKAPKELTPKQASIIYADKANVLNVALFGVAAKEWRDKNPARKGNIPDYANINELICFSNNDGISQHDRLLKLNKIAIQQMTILNGMERGKFLK
jgi:hypothetical protein